MVNQEGARRRIFGISATPKQETTLPRPKTEPAPEPPKRKKGVGKKARIALAGLVTLGAVEATGAVVNEQINDIPLSTQSVKQDLAWPWNLGKSAVEDIQGLFNKESSPIFDNSAAKGVVGPNNILYVPREEFDKTPLADGEGNPIFDFPWDNKYPDIKMRYEKSLWPRPDWWKSGPPSPDTRNLFEGRDSLPAGFELRTPYPGRLFWSGSVYDEEASRKSPSNPYGLAVYNGPIDGGSIGFIAPNGVFYAFNIGIQDNRGGALPIEPLIDAPLTGLENDGGRDWEKGTLVERGQPIFRTAKEGKLLMYIGGWKNGSLDGPEIEHIPGNFIFQTGKDPAGTQKLLVSDFK